MAHDDNDQLRVPPHDIQSEQSVLGGMMLSPDAAVNVLGMLRPADFYRPAHQAICAAISVLLDRGEPVDQIAVHQEMVRRGDGVHAENGAYLHTCTEAIPTAANTTYYAKIVSDKALLRRLVEVGTHAAQIGYSGQGEAVDLVDGAQGEMMAITEGQSTDEDLLPADYMPEVMDHMEKQASTPDGVLQGLATGLADMDALTNGWVPGQLIIVGARPSTGKSTLALDWSRQAAIKEGETVAFFSLEMGRTELGERMISAEAKIPLHTIKSGLLTEQDWERMRSVMPRINASKLVIKDKLRSLGQIRAACRRMKRSMGLRLVVVDYLQLVDIEGRYDNRQHEVTEVSKALKQLAKELDVTVVALSQLNRGPENRPDKRPQMSDLRESGSLEQDADVVILLYREDVHDKESPRAGEADLLVVKHRNGPTTDITVAFQGHYSRFLDLPPG